MKQGWEVKKLGEVCELYQPKTISVDMLNEEGRYFVYGANGVIGRYHEYNHETSEVLVTCRGATCGTINVSEPYSWINGNAMVVKPMQSQKISKSFLVYYLKSIDWSNVITGAAQPQLTRKSLFPLSIPIPPMAEQERIVKELDCLSGIIEKKKQQLKELDALAQSIFYEMFGDPVENDKGWEIKVVGELADFYNGVAHENEISELGKYYVVNSKFISTNGKVCKFSDLQKFPLLKNDIVMVMSDVPNGKALAKCYIVKEDDKYTLNQRICAFRNYELVTIFLYYCLNRNPFYLRFDDGNGQTNLRKKDVLNCPIILPPLALQQQFASKIELIEKQKELIKQSIQETETLFNSRMEFYFSE